MRRSTRTYVVRLRHVELGRLGRHDEKKSAQRTIEEERPIEYRVHRELFVPFLDAKAHGL